MSAFLVLVPSADASTTACQYDTPGCESQLQQVLGEDLAPIEINENQLTIPSFDYVDPNSTTGADLISYLEAEQAAGVAPESASIATTVGASEGALDLAAASFGPETLGVSIVGAFAATYGIKLLWGIFSPPISSDFSSFAWTRITAGHGICPGFDGGPSSDYPSGWSPSAIGDGGAYFLAPAGGGAWSTDFNPQFDPSGPCGSPDPATVPPGTYSGAEAADVQAYFDLGSADAGESSCPGDAPTMVPTKTVGGAQYYVLAITAAQLAGEIECQIEEIGPNTGTPAVTTTITAPSPATIDFSAPRSFITSPALTTGVNTALNDVGATTDVIRQTGNWFYDGTSTVKYGPYVVPDGDTQVRIYCEDPDSNTDWTSVTPGSTVTVTRTGVGGLTAGDGFSCYLDAGGDGLTQSASETETADPGVSPNPETFDEGTETGSDPDSGGGDGTTGTTFTCPSVNVGTIDFTPLENLNLGNSFPFGFLTWAQNGVAGWNGAQQAPTFQIPQLGAGQGHPVTVDLSVLDGLMVTVREWILIACSFGFVWFLATTVFGFKEWGVGEQGVLF